MKIKRYFALLSSLLIIACTEEITQPSVLDTNGNSTIVASIIESKASVTPNGNFFWNTDDRISVYTSKNDFRQFEIVSGAGTKIAKFSGELSEDEFLSSLAIYPSSLSPEVYGDNLYVTLPSEYKLQDDNLVCQMPMVAEIQDDGTATFRHVGGIMRFTIREVPLEAVKLSVSTQTRITGTFGVSNNVIETEYIDSLDELTIDLGEFHNTRDIVANIPIPTGTYSDITIRLLNDSDETVYEKTSSKTRTVTAGQIYIFTPIIISHPSVDLGLPSGTLWAEYNIGGASMLDYGLHFAYGETASKTSFQPDNYSYSKPILEDHVLAVEDDAAYVIWGENWRIPTKEQWQELIDNCTIVQILINGILGRLFIGPNGKELFFPYAGFNMGNEASSVGGIGKYLTSSAYPERYSTGGGRCYETNSQYASIYTEKYPVSIGDAPLYYGYSIRAVSSKTANYLKSAINLEVGKTTILTVSSPTDNVSWHSSDDSIATVASDGTIIGISEGKATITATIGTIERSCEVTVLTKPNISVFTYSKRGSILNGLLLNGGQLTFRMTNNSHSVVNIVSVQVGDYNISLFDSRKKVSKSLYPGETTDITYTLGRKQSVDDIGYFTVEYNGCYFEYISIIKGM